MKNKLSFVLSDKQMRQLYTHIQYYYLNCCDDMQNFGFSGSSSDDCVNSLLVKLDDIVRPKAILSQKQKREIRNKIQKEFINETHHTWNQIGLICWLVDTLVIGIKDSQVETHFNIDMKCPTRIPIGMEFSLKELGVTV